MPKAPALVLDVTQFSIVALCPYDGCTWRTVQAVRGDVWKAAALHLRLDHGDTHAAANATRARIHAEDRARKRTASRAGERQTAGRAVS